MSGWHQGCGRRLSSGGTDPGHRADSFTHTRMQATHLRGLCSWQADERTLTHVRSKVQAHIASHKQALSRAKTLAHFFLQECTTHTPPYALPRASSEMHAHKRHSKMQKLTNRHMGRPSAVCTCLPDLTNAPRTHLHRPCLCQAHPGQALQVTACWRRRRLRCSCVG